MLGEVYGLKIKIMTLEELEEKMYNAIVYQSLFCLNDLDEQRRNMANNCALIAHKELSKLHQTTVSICACGSKEYYVEQYKDVTKYYCKSCHEKISKH